MSKDHPSKKKRRRDRKRFQKRKLAIINKIKELEEEVAMWVVAGCPSLWEEYKVGMIQRNIERLKLELQHIKLNEMYV